MTNQSEEPSAKSEEPSGYIPKSPRQHFLYWSAGLREKTRARRAENKAYFVALLGGKCCLCGYDKHLAALEFDHIDPSQKKYDIAGILKWLDRDKAWDEIKKCRLLCSNCHHVESFEKGHLGHLAKGQNRRRFKVLSGVCIQCKQTYQSTNPAKFCSNRCRNSHNGPFRRSRVGANKCKQPSMDLFNRSTF